MNIFRFNSSTNVLNYHIIASMGNKNPPKKRKSLKTRMGFVVFLWFALSRHGRVFKLNTVVSNKKSEPQLEIS